MKIQKYDRVRYSHNPLADVICQVRFPHASSLLEKMPDSLTRSLGELGYTELSEEQIFSVSIAFPGVGNGHAEPPKTPTARVFQLASTTHAFKVSVCSDFIALTCSKYLSWDDFRPRFISAYSSICAAVDGIFPIRIGLRYKDLIERESLGLTGVPWCGLIAPFLLGPLSPNALSADGENPEGAIETFVSQSTIQLADCGLVLQSALLRSTVDERRAFLIDSDFFINNENPDAFGSVDQLVSCLDRLHNNAGSLFRQGITEELHNALGPNPV